MTDLENNEKITNFDISGDPPDLLETIRQMERDLETFRPHRPVWVLSIEEWKKLPDWLSLRDGRE